MYSLSICCIVLVYKLDTTNYFLLLSVCGSRLQASMLIRLTVLVDLRKLASRHCPSPVVFRRRVARRRRHAKRLRDFRQHLVLPAHNHRLFGWELFDTCHEPFDVVSSRGGVDTNSKPIGKRRQRLHGAVAGLVRVGKKMRRWCGKRPRGVGEEMGNAFRALHPTWAEVVATVLLAVTD